MKLTPPTGYRALEFGETPLETDFAIWGYRPEVIQSAKIHAGKILTRESNPAMGDTYIFIRPIAPQGWISVKDRLPDNMQDILIALEGVSFPRSGYYMAGFLVYNAGGYAERVKDVTHWMPAPPIPVPPKPEIKVGQYKVKFQKDGSIRVGCEEISSELFEQIAARRKEEMQ